MPYGPVMALHLFILLAGLAGFVRFHRHLVIRIGMAAVACVAGLHLITFPQPRYALTVVPLLISAAAPFLVWAIRASNMRPWGRDPT